MLLVLLACHLGDVFDRPMGAACTDSARCEAPGSCLAGVCSGYPCAEDADCAEPQPVCGDFGGARACATPCADDADCDGDQRCAAVSAADGTVADYCL